MFDSSSERANSTLPSLLAPMPEFTHNCRVRSAERRKRRVFRRRSKTCVFRRGLREVVARRE